MADYYIKKVLVNFLGVTSWESVPDEVKKVCYKDFPDKASQLGIRFSMNEKKSWNICACLK